MARFKFVQWIITFLETSDDFTFEWDNGHSQKSESKHGVSIEQIESCFLDDQMIVLGVQIEPVVEEDRYGIIAKDFTGKLIFVSFTIRAGRIRAISGRLANKSERDNYEA